MFTWFYENGSSTWAGIGHGRYHPDALDALTGQGQAVGDEEDATVALLSPPFEVVAILHDNEVARVRSIQRSLNRGILTAAVLGHDDICFSQLETPAAATVDPGLGPILHIVLATGCGALPTGADSAQAVRIIAARLSFIAASAATSAAVIPTGLSFTVGRADTTAFDASLARQFAAVGAVFDRSRLAAKVGVTGAISAGILIFAVRQPGTLTLTQVAQVRYGAGVAVVAARLIGFVGATQARITGLVRANVVVVASQFAAALAATQPADISDSACVVIVTRSLVRLVGTPKFRNASVIRAGIAVITVQFTIALAVSERATISGSAGVVVVTRSGVRLVQAPHPGRHMRCR